jgi:hypothetical protein
METNETKTFRVTPELQALQAVAGKDETRFNLTGVHFNGTRAEATTGHYLIATLKPEGAPENCTIRFNSPKIAGKMCFETYTSAGIAYSSGVQALVGSQSKNTAELLDVEYPDTKLVANDALEMLGHKRTITISLDATYLAAIAAYLNANGDKKAQKGLVDITFKLGTDNKCTGPMFVTGFNGENDQSAAILMPAHPTCQERITKVVKQVFKA